MPYTRSWLTDSEAHTASGIAAAIRESLSQNHPFIDGNKRVAVTVTAAFLKLNGFRLEFDDADAYLFLMSLYESGRMEFAELDKCLRLHLVVE